MVWGILDRYMQKKMKLDFLPTPGTGMNSKWIKNLNVSLKIIEILQENMGSKVLDISHRNIFSDISPQGKETKEKINK